jgi:hypothetical protein
MPSPKKLNLDNLDLDTLYNLEYETDVFLFKQAQGGEDYTAQYKKDTEVFEDFIKKTVSLKNKIRSLFTTQAERLPYLVNLYYIKADDGIDDFSTLFIDQEWQKEEKDTGSILFDSLYPIYFLGVTAEENVWNYTSILNADPANPTKIISDYSSRLGKDINSTTRDIILKHVKVSIKLGEDRETLIIRLNKVLKNEARARMIAQTESVRMYGRGRLEIALEIGLKEKEWESGVGACPICMELKGQRIQIDEQFYSSYLATDLPGEPAHPHCKCSVRYFK